MVRATTGERRIVSVQVAADVRAELERLATAADRSLSAEVRRAICEHLERERSAEPTRV